MRFPPTGPWLRDESGQSLTEYGLLALLVAVVLIGVVAIVGNEFGGPYSSVANQLNEWLSP